MVGCPSQGNFAEKRKLRNEGGGGGVFEQGVGMSVLVSNGQVKQSEGKKKRNDIGGCTYFLGTN